MNEFIYKMMSINMSELALVVILCAIGLYFMKLATPVPMLAAASFPLLILGSLAAHALLQDSSLILRLERGPGYAVTTGIGMSLVAVTIVVVVRVIIFCKDTFGSKPELLRHQ